MAVSCSVSTVEVACTAPVVWAVLVLPAVALVLLNCQPANRPTLLSDNNILALPQSDIGGEVKNDAYFELAFLEFQA